MRNAIPLVKVAKQPHHHIHLLSGTLLRFSLFATSWNGTVLIIPSGSAQHTFTSDALGSWGVRLCLEQLVSLLWVHVHM